MTQSSNFPINLLLADGGPPPETLYNFFMIMLTFVVIVLLVTLVYVVRRAMDQRAGEVGGWEMRGAFGRIRAVARITLAEAIRTKLVFGLVAIILISIPLWWLTATGDGTIKGQVQMFVAYSMGFSGFLLGLITILFSCSSLSAEIANRQIYGLVSKPIPRWQIIAGKVTGVLVLDAVLLTLAALATYGGVRLTLSRFETLVARELEFKGQLTPSEAATAVASLQQVRGIGGKGMDSPIIPTMASALGKTDQQIGDILLRLTEETRVNLRKYDELRRQVLVSRAWIQPEKEDLTAEVNHRIEELRNSGNLTSELTEPQLRKQLTEVAELSSRTIPPGEFKKWTIHGPPPSTDDQFILSIRFKLQPSHAMQAMPEAGLEEETFRAAWGVGRPGSDKFATIVLALPTAQFNEFEIPKEVVDPDGTVVINFANADPRSAEAVFEKDFGIQVMYRVGGFGLGLFQATLAMMIPLICLATIGVCASTFLSPRVGTFLVIVLWILTSSMGFVSDSLGVTKDYIDPTDISTALKLRVMTVKAVGIALAIGDQDPISSLIIGLGVGWRDLWTNTWQFVLIKCGVVMVIAVLVFRRRELAAVIVEEFAMKPWSRRWVLAGLAVGVLALSATRVAPLNAERERLKLLAAPIPESARPSMMLTPMLALGRAPLVDYLWMRASKAKDDGQFYDAYQLSKLICDLQPRFASVWAFQAWNMAYNISVTLDTPEERWRWVRNGYELLRDKGIPLNPGNTQLYRELSWIFFHKIGEWTDEKHNYYKLQLALIIEDALGPPPENWVRPGRNEGDFYRSYDYQPLADAPREWIDVAKADDVKALAERLQTFGFDISKPGVYLGMLTGLRAGNLAIPGAASGDEANRLHALQEALADAEQADARSRVEHFWRAWKLRNEQKIEPQRLLEIQEQIGGITLDLRVPWTHALYWSIMGLQKGADKKVLLDTNKLNINRTEFFCLTKLFFFGRMQMSKQAHLGEPPLFMPDIRFAEVVFNTYLRESRQYEIDKTNDEPVGRDFFSGFVGITRTICLRYAELGMRDKAEEKYQFLKKNYADPVYGNSLDEFLLAQAKSDRENPDFRTAMARICPLIDRGIIQYAYDEDEEAVRFIARAKQVYENYKEALVSSRNEIKQTFSELVEYRCHMMGGTMYRATYEKICGKLNVTPLPEADDRPTTKPVP